MNDSMVAAEQAAGGADRAPLLEMRDVVKTFPGGVMANDHVDLEVRRGEIHGILGENGAGKSTLMKILYGLYVEDEGEIRLDGERLDITSPADALDVGIGMVHQHFMHVPKFTVVENVVLGLRESAYENPILRFLTRDYSAAIERIRDLTDRYGIDLDPEARVHDLDIGQKQRLEIVKALYRDVDLLVLDEPTAVLPPHETEQMFDILTSLVAEGDLSIIFISHKLDEVTEITDRVTVLRDGRVVDTLATAETTRAELAELMVGQEVLFDVEKEHRAPGDVALSARGITDRDYRGVDLVRNVDLTVREGEIVGLAGVSGNGQAALVESLVGVSEPDAGTISVKGTDLTGKPTRAFIDSGVSYVPADRTNEGSAADLDLTYNVMLKQYRQFRDGPFLDYDAGRALATDLVERFDIQVPDPETPVKHLSGGNLQKLILARELSLDPDVLVANQPTWGLDVGAIKYVHELLLEERDDGTAIFLVSENLDEVLQLSDRIAVIYEGEIVHETTASEADRERIGRYMTEGSNATDPVAQERDQ